MIENHADSDSSFVDRMGKRETVDDNINTKNGTKKLYF